MRAVFPDAILLNATVPSSKATASIAVVNTTMRRISRTTVQGPRKKITEPVSDFSCCCCIRRIKSLLTLQSSRPSSRLGSVGVKRRDACMRAVQTAFNQSLASSPFPLSHAAFPGPLADRCPTTHAGERREKKKKEAEKGHSQRVYNFCFVISVPPTPTSNQSASPLLRYSDQQRERARHLPRSLSPVSPGPVRPLRPQSPWAT